MKYTATIGLEVHVQLKTRSKMFCACPVEVGAEPNTHTCPICLGLPGALPVINREALRLTVLTGLMLGCDVAPISKFDRKNYFYPDMPKNYQISQYDMPLCTNGSVPLHDLAYPKDAQKSIVTPDKEVHLVRIHLEEDVAKSFHFENSTGIDFNRAGTPLMEIVTQPELNSPGEAFAFLTALKQILIYGGVSDADMEKGQLRCDCNVSVRPEKQTELGAKIEIKNMNSISGVRRALAYEVKRQISVLESDESLEQETRGWDEYQVSPYDAGVLANDLELARYFEAAAKGARKPKNIANWILNDLQNGLSAAGKTIRDCPIPPEALDELVNLIDSGKISSKQGKDVFAEMFASGKTAAAIVKEKGIEQLSDMSAIGAICDEVIAANPKPVADFKSGNVASLNFLKGQVIKLSKGKANPQLVGEILERKLKS